MSQVVTELVIDANTSGADQFSQSMDNASSSAQKGVGSVASLTLAVAGVGVAFVGSLAALRGFVDYVGATNKELVDLATNAANAGMSTKSFQETLFAAKASGLSDKDFIAGLDRIGADLTAASRGATDFGKLFEQNGISIKNANGELKTTEQALTDISTLIRNSPTPQVANAIASIVGLSKDWIPFLRQGKDEIEAQKKAASDLGVIIDDATIAKAKDFNSQWHTAIATWDLQFKASLAGILPLLVKMATLASTIIDGVSSVGSSFSLWTTPDDQKSKQQLNDQADYALKLIDLQNRFGNSPGGFPQAKINNLQSLLGIPEGASIDQAIAYLDKLSALYDKTPARVVITQPGNGSTALPPTGGGGKDQLETEIDRLNKHIATTNADTEAVNQSAAAQAGLRAEATLYAAAERAGKTDLEQYADQFFALREKVEAATQALNKAKIASDIKFGRDTALLSQEDVAIAQQLKSIYPDVATALNSVEAAGIRTNNAMKGLSSAIETNLTTGLTDIVSGTKSVSQGFSDMGLAVVKAIEQMIIKLYVVTPLMQALQAALGVFGPAIGPTSINGAPLPKFASGTDSAPGGWSIVGENGPELMKVPAGARILPNGVAPSSGGGGTQVNVNVMNYGNDNVSVSQKQNSGGGLDLEVLIGQAAASQMAKKGSALRQVTDNRTRLASR